MLLCKIHPEEPKLAIAIFLMKAKTNSHLSSRTFERIKNASIAATKTRPRHVHTFEQRAKISQALKAKMTDEHRQKLSDIQRGKKPVPMTEAHLANIRAANKRLTEKRQEQRKIEEAAFNESIAHLPPVERAAAWLQSKWSHKVKKRIPKQKS